MIYCKSILLFINLVYIVLGFVIISFVLNLQFFIMLETWYEMKLFEKVFFVQKNLNNEDDFVYMYIGNWGSDRKYKILNGLCLYLISFYYQMNNYTS